MRESVLLDAVSIPLEANGQTAWLIDQAFPGANMSDFAGLVRCDAVGEGLFTAVALEMDPGNRIFTTLPVFPVHLPATVLSRSKGPVVRETTRIVQMCTRARMHHCSNDRQISGQRFRGYTIPRSPV